MDLSSFSTEILTAGALAIVSVISGGLGALGKTWIDARKLKGQERLNHDAQLIAAYHSLADSLQKRVDKLTVDNMSFQKKYYEDLRAADKAHAECQRENALMKQEVVSLKEEMKELKSKINGSGLPVVENATC